MQANNFAREERGATADEGEFIILVVGNFVFGASAGFGGRDFFARVRVVNLHAHFPGVGARETREFDATASGDAIEHIVTAIAGAGNAAKKIFVAAEDGFGGFPDRDVVLVKGEFVENEIAAEAASGARVGGEDFDAAFAAGDADADFGGEKVEFDGAGFGFEDGAVFVADGLAFLGELGAVLLAVAENGDEAAGSGEESIDGPRGENGALAELARPVETEDAGGVVAEDGDLIRTKFHARTVRGDLAEEKDLCRTIRRRGKAYSRLVNFLIDFRQPIVRVEFKP
jgi:hypothetical protein